MGARVFIGASDECRIERKVLEWSVRNINKTVECIYIDDMIFDKVKEKNKLSATGFTYSRFLVPLISDIGTPSIYLDSDIILLDDVEKILEYNDVKKDFVFTKKRKNDPLYTEYAVLIVNNSAELVEKIKSINWNNVSNIEEAFDSQGITSEAKIPVNWNSYEFISEDVSLIHFGNMVIQPWRSIRSKNKKLWLNQYINYIRSNNITFLGSCVDSGGIALLPMIYAYLNRRKITRNGDQF